MAYLYQTLTQDNSGATIHIKADKRYFKLVGMFSNEISVTDLKELNLNLKISSLNNGSSFEEPIPIGNASVETRGSIEYLHIGYEPSNTLVHTIKLTIDELSNKDISVG